MSQASHRSFVVLSAALAASAIVAGAQGAVDWTGSSGSSSRWNDGANWSPAGVPGALDTANFPSLLAPPPREPTVWQAQDIAGLTINNSAGFTWSILRDNDTSGTGGRTLNIGAGGITVTGTGTHTSNWNVINTNATAAQTWNIGAGNTLLLSTSTVVGVNNHITKSGAGTLFIQSTNTGTAGWSVTGGVLVNNRAGGGLGTARGNSVTGTMVSVYNTGVYEVRQNVSREARTFYNGSTLRGNGTSAGISSSSNLAGEYLTIDNAANTSVRFTTVNASDVFTIGRGVLGGAADSLITVDGPGRMNISDGYGATYAGSWKLDAPIVQLQASNALNKRPTEVAKGLIKFAGTTSNGVTADHGGTWNVTGDTQFQIDRTSVGGVVTSSDPGAASGVARALGQVSVGSNEIKLDASSNVNGGYVGGNINLSLPVRLRTTDLRLGGNATIDVTNATAAINGNDFVVEFRALQLSQSTTGVSLTKTGTGQLAISNAASGYTGNTFLNGGTLLVSNAAGLGTGALTTSTGTTATFTNSASGWNIVNDLRGTGTVASNGAGVLTLQGSAISPGNSAGILTINGNIALAVDGAEKSALNIEVTGGGAVAGTDYDQLALASGRTLTGLSNTILNVSFSGVTQADLTGDVLTIVTAPGANLGSQSFSSVNFLTPGSSADVTYNATSITLSNIVIPEPTSLSLLALGGMGLLRRRTVR